MNDLEGEAESREALTRVFAALGLLLAALVVAVGTSWAFAPGGGGDFRVFYEAWRHVLEGQGALVYAVSPDRFLYAPGFAWLLAPLGWLDFKVALALWCLAKAGLIGLLVREFGAATNACASGARATERSGETPPRWVALGIAAWGVVAWARPLLIDFQYGQVNTFILGACAWGLVRHLRPAVESPRWQSELGDLLSWAVLAVAAVAKIFPLPLLLVPLLSRSAAPASRRRVEIAGASLGLAVVLLLPLLSLGASRAIALYHDWWGALVSRGLPLESHNQSFAAFLHHWLSGEPTEIIAWHRHALSLGWAVASPRTLGLLAAGWSFLSMGTLLAWLMLRPARPGDLDWLAVSIGLLVVPSHLIWKPYFVLAIPAAMAAALACEWRLVVLVAAAINLTGFDILGSYWGAVFESSPVFLVAHLTLLLAAVRRPRRSLSA